MGKGITFFSESLQPTSVNNKIFGVGAIGTEVFVTCGSALAVICGYFAASAFFCCLTVLEFIMQLD